jgi:chromate transporter
MSETMPAPSADAPAAPHHSVTPPTLLQLFVAWAIIAVCGFGGVLYWSRRMMVDERKWLTAEEFNEAYALCNFLPGPNVINFSVVFGRQMRGAAGAFVALAGLLGPPFALVTFIGFLYAFFGELAPLQRMFAGLAAAAAGLTISTSLLMAKPILHDRSVTTPAIAAAVFLGVGVLRWPLYWVLAVLIPLSIALAWWGRRQAGGQGPGPR